MWKLSYSIMVDCLRYATIHMRQLKFNFKFKFEAHELLFLEQFNCTQLQSTVVQLQLTGRTIGKEHVGLMWHLCGAIYTLSKSSKFSSGTGSSHLKRVTHYRVKCWCSKIAMTHSWVKRISMQDSAIENTCSKNSHPITLRSFLANVNVRSLIAVARPSVTCLSPVTLVYPTQVVVIFRNFSMAFGTLAICWHPRKILWRSSQGGGVKHKRCIQM